MQLPPPSYFLAQAGKRKSRAFINIARLYLPLELQPHFISRAKVSTLPRTAKEGITLGNSIFPIFDWAINFYAVYSSSAFPKLGSNFSYRVFRLPPHQRSVAMLLAVHIPSLPVAP